LWITLVWFLCLFTLFSSAMPTCSHKKRKKITNLCPYDVNLIHPF
jgi:hypothetical protein